jgi:predicted nucleotidyltransferase
LIAVLIRFNPYIQGMGSGFSEGDYIKTIDGLYFAVKGGLHGEDLVVAILRYIPDENGERAHNGKHYRRVYDVDCTTKVLQENYPDYINYIDWLGLSLQSVPHSKIAEVFKPADKLKDILINPDSKLAKQITRFVETLSESSGVSTSFFGVSGSLLIGLETMESDIDLNVYGETEGRRVYEALRQLRSETDWVSPYDTNSIGSVLNSRWGDTGLDLDRLRSIECGKVLHGLVYGVNYFIRLLVDEKEARSIPIKNVSILATVTDATQSIFTPCTYRVENVQTCNESSEYVIVELKSYRGKFTEQTKIGDMVQARGTLEKVTRHGSVYYRLMLGGRGDYLVPV